MYKAENSCSEKQMKGDQKEDATTNLRISINAVIVTVLSVDENVLFKRTSKAYINFL